MTHSELLKLVKYNPETGLFILLPRDISWFKNTQAFKAWNTKFAGKLIVDNLHPRTGYQRFTLLNKSYQSHILAWLYMTGEMPSDEVDHINHIRSDNRWENLRIVDRTDNSKNLSKRTNNTSGFTGVSYSNQRNKWIAQISVNGKNKNLGRFSSFDEAVSVWKKASIEHGYHANHGAENAS